MAIDLEHLRRYTGGDEAVERQLFELFIPNAESYVAALESAVDDDA